MKGFEKPAEFLKELSKNFPKVSRHYNPSEAQILEELAFISAQAELGQNMELG